MLLAAVAMIRFPRALEEYRIYAKAEERAAASGTSDVLDALYALVEKHPDSVPIMVKYLDFAMGAGYYDHATYVFDNYLVGQSLSDEEYDRMLNYSERLDSYYLTYDAIDTIMAEAYAEEPKDEEAMKMTAWIREYRCFKGAGYFSNAGGKS